MTYEESITALELCGDENNCTKCPFRDKRFEPDISCAEELMRTAAEQMKRLKAENERLNIRNKTLSAITRNYDWKFSKVKVEAYKEFAERWHKKLNESKKLMIPNVIADGALDIASCITDTVAKEMGAEHKEPVSMIDGHIEE